VPDLDSKTNLKIITRNCYVSKNLKKLFINQAIHDQCITYSEQLCV